MDQPRDCEAGVPIETMRMLAGHRNGMSDHHLKRNPRIATACEAVERHYFA